MNFVHHKKIKNNLINLQSTDPWQVCPPDELGKLALGASEAIFETLGRCRGVKGCCTHFVQPDGGRSALGEAVAHAPPARRGARSTPRGYAPLESSGNGCLRQPMQTFFYCDSHESQQRGKTPRVKMLVKVFKKHMAHEPCESKYIIHIPEIMFKLFSF